MAIYSYLKHALEYDFELILVFGIKLVKSTYSLKMLLKTFSSL